MSSSSNFSVVVLDDFENLAATVPAYERLKARADVRILAQRLDTPDKIEAALRDANAILLMRERTRLGEREFSRLPKLNFIAQTGRTSLHLDLAAATQRGIAIAGTPGDNGKSTTELTVGLILALLRNIPMVDRRMREESWPPIVGQMIEGKTIGVLGFGRIGRQVARILKALDARVVAHSRTLRPDEAAPFGAECVPMETLLKESNLVTLHVPLNPNTRGLLGDQELAMMRPGAFLVNTARGPLVSEQALIQALSSGHLGGAALDVFEIEPLPMEHPLRRLDNVILLSHRGYATREILQERFQQAMENILAFMDGKPLSLLNPDVKTGHQPTGSGAGGVTA